MIKGTIKYGISLLPENCLAFRDGYRFGAYKQDLENTENMHIVEWFKDKAEIQVFVNAHPEYGKAKDGIA